MTVFGMYKVLKNKHTKKKIQDRYHLRWDQGALKYLGVLLQKGFNHN